MHLPLAWAQEGLSVQCQPSEFSWKTAPLIRVVDNVLFEILHKDSTWATQTQKIGIKLLWNASIASDATMLTLPSTSLDLIKIAAQKSQSKLRVMEQLIFVAFVHQNKWGGQPESDPTSKIGVFTWKLDLHGLLAHKIRTASSRAAARAKTCMQCCPGRAITHFCHQRENLSPHPPWQFSQLKSVSKWCHELTPILVVRKFWQSNHKLQCQMLEVHSQGNQQQPATIWLTCLVQCASKRGRSTGPLPLDSLLALPLPLCQLLRSFDSCCFKAEGASVMTTARLSSSLIAFEDPYSASYLSKSASHSWSAAGNSFSFEGNFGLRRVLLQIRLLEWFSGVNSLWRSLQNSKPFWSRIPLAILTAIGISWVHEFNIAKSFLPRSAQSSVMSATTIGSTDFLAASRLTGYSEPKSAK